MNRGVLFTAASGILYGSIGYFGVQLMELGFSVSELLFWRFFFSTVLLLPVAFRGVTASKMDLLKLFFFGAVFYGVGTGLYFEASKSIGTGLAMCIFFAYPIVVSFFSFFFNKEALSSITILSLVCIVVGCALIALGESFVVDIMGISLALLSGIGYGAYVFATKQVTQKVEPMLATFTVVAGASLAFFFSVSDIQVPATPIAWMHIALFGILGTVLPVLFMLVGLRSISATKASIISVLEPVTVLIVGASVLEESVTSLQLVGALIILASAILVQLDREKVQLPSSMS